MTGEEQRAWERAQGKRMIGSVPHVLAGPWHSLAVWVRLSLHKRGIGVGSTRQEPNQGLWERKAEGRGRPVAVGRGGFRTGVVFMG